MKNVFETLSTADRYLSIGTFGQFHYDRVKNVNGCWLKETWEILESLNKEQRKFAGIYNGDNLIGWALTQGLLTIEEFKYLYILLLDPCVNPSEVCWEFVSPLLCVKK